MTVKRILVVDDRENWRETFQLMLREEGYEVETAESYETALQALNRRIFHLALVDISLADESNTDGLRIIQAIEDNHRPTAVIAITGYVKANHEGNQLLKSPRVKAFLRKRELDTAQFLKLVAESIGTLNE